MSGPVLDIDYPVISVFPEPDQYTTVKHWYLVCAEDEKHANLCGPFFAIEDANTELRCVEDHVAAGFDGCQRKHFLVAGPAPRGRFRILRPTIYEAERGRWWDEWAYSTDGRW